MYKVKLLPRWVLPNTIPSVYDTTSGTCIEMVSKVYGSMRDLQNAHNNFVDSVNKTITEFIEGTNKDYECFKEQIAKLVHGYIKMLDQKVKFQDKAIKDGLEEIKANIRNTVKEILVEMNIQSGAKILETNVTDYAENMETYNNEYDIVVVHE